MKKLGQKIYLPANYPKSKRDLNSLPDLKSAELRIIGRKFIIDYLDRDRNIGYEDLVYYSKFWQSIVPTI